MKFLLTVLVFIILKVWEFLCLVRFIPVICKWIFIVLLSFHAPIIMMTICHITKWQWVMTDKNPIFSGLGMGLMIMILELILFVIYASNKWEIDNFFKENWEKAKKITKIK